MLHIGCIADDFTGAGDAASFLALAGLKTLLIVWPSGSINITDYDAVVIALKSRSAEPITAVGESIAAVAWLKEQKAEKIYFKYCSTFDSTKKGNIGTVADAILERYRIPYTVLCPTLLSNGRCVKNAVLYVNGIPLSESSMKNHPLNPMRNSSIRTYEGHSKYPVILFQQNFSITVNILII